MRSVLDDIHYVWHYEWPAHHTASTLSPIGHTLQYMTRGSYSLELNNIDYLVKEGDIVYYAGLEPHRYRGAGDSVSMYSINFSADRLPSISTSERVFRDSGKFATDFRNIYEGFHQPEGALVSLSAFHSLSKILRNIYFAETDTNSSMEGSRWVQIEILIKTERNFRVKSAELSSRFGLSPSSLYRLCIKSTGKSPEKRIKEIRMNEALNMLKYTGMNISEIAAYLSYSRINEFSREFSRYMGKPPTEYLKQKLRFKVQKI